MIQKNIPRVAADSSTAFSLVIFGSGSGGINAKIKSQKKIDIIIAGSQAIPQYTGPKGVIQSCPDHVARKTIKKKNQSPRKGRFENSDTNNIIIKVVINTPGITV
jgi:hypothetical protein